MKVFGGWGNCCCGGTKMCLTQCSGTVDVVGALIQLYSGGVLIDQCTTDATGCCTFSESGTFDVKSVVSGVVHDFGNRTLAGTTINLAQPDGTGDVCCLGTGGAPSILIPTTLTLTDANTTTTLAYNPISGSWVGCYQWNPGIQVGTIQSGGPCVATNQFITLSNANIPVQYILSCTDSGHIVVSQRTNFVWAQNFGGTLTVCGAYGPPWTCGPCSTPTFYWCTGACTGLYTAMALITSAPTGSGPSFSWSGSFPSTTGTAPAVANLPAPGTVTITA